MQVQRLAQQLRHRQKCHLRAGRPVPDPVVLTPVRAGDRPSGGPADVTAVALPGTREAAGSHAWAHGDAGGLAAPTGVLEVQLIGRQDSTTTSSSSSSGPISDARYIPYGALRASNK